MNSKQLKQALRDLDAIACEAAVGGAGLASDDDARHFLDAIRHGGCMVVEWPNADRERRRDDLVQKCRELLARLPNAPFLEQFEEHVAAAKVIERGFRAIELTLSSLPAFKRPPAEQVWGVLRWVEGGMEHLERQIQAASAANKSLHDITSLRVHREDGEAVSPDAVVSAAVSNAGSTLLMLGHRHRLIDKSTGSLLLPVEPPLDESAIKETGTFIFLSLAWTQLRRGWERVRFLDGKVRCEEHDVPVRQGETRRMEVIEFSRPEIVELLDQIAGHRLSQRLLTNQIDFRTQTNIASKIELPGAEVLPLPPDAWISLEEFNASHSLSQHYCLPIDDVAATAHGLSLKAWLRGYAIYARCLARDSEDQPALRIISYTEADLTTRLTAGGLSPEQAALFIRLTTFSRKSKDLFDTPLIRSTDDRLHFFAPAYLSPNPGAVLVSRLGRLGVKFEDKGKRFEKQTLEVFSAAGVPAKSFKYKLDDQIWDCDVAALWDDTLFVFECKNYGLPDGRLPSLHHFLVQLAAHIEQAKRIAEQLDRNPAIVRQHFGEQVSWTRVVPCVLHALPWTSGQLDDVYCYDASALGKFFEDGFIAIKMIAKAGPNAHIVRRHKFPLWRGPRPMPADLLRELSDAAQLRLPIAEREITARLTPLSPDIGVVVPEWTPRELTLEQQFRAFGSGEEEAKRLVKEFEQFPDAVSAAHDRVARKAAAPA